MKYKEQWIMAFATGSTAKEIQTLGRLGKDRYYMLKNDDEFMGIVQERKDAIIKAAVTLMGSYINKDIGILQHEIIENKKTSKQVRMLAIKTMLTTFAAWRQEVDIVERLERLEQSQDDLGTKF